MGCPKKWQAVSSQASEILVDKVSRDMLRELCQDGRMSYSELGRRVGLSAPAAAERVRRLEAVGVIEGYRAKLDLARVGRPVTAFIRLRVARKAEVAFMAFVRDCNDILECHLVTGADSHIVKVAVASNQMLDVLIDRIRAFNDPAGSPAVVPLLISSAESSDPKQSDREKGAT